MAFDFRALGDREKEILRLLAQGFDAKSAALELGISVHTVNERLRTARRKLQVTSSREAARLLLGSERKDPNFLVYKGIGLGTGAAADEGKRPESGIGAKRTYALLAGGLVAMSLVIFAVLLTATPAPTAELGPLPNWSLAAAFPGGLSQQRNEIHLDGNRLLWNGNEASEASVRAFLAIVEQHMDPQPLTILSYSAQVAPQRIQHMRLLIDGALNCKPATCLEVTQPRK